MERLVAHLFEEALGETIATPMLRMTYDEAMSRYGSDKPDLRFEMELIDVSEVIRGSNFKVFESVLQNGGQVKAINVKGYAGIPRRELDGHPPEDVIRDGGGVADVGVLGKSRGLETLVGELADEGLEGDAVLKRHACEGADGIHQAADR